MRIHRFPLVSRFEVVCRNELSETMKVTQNNTVGAEHLPGRWGKPTGCGWVFSSSSRSWLRKERDAFKCVAGPNLFLPQTQSVSSLSI